MERTEVDMSLKNPVTLPGIDSGTVRLVAQRINHYATPGPDGSITVHIYVQTIHRTTQLTNLFGRLSGIRTQNELTA